MGVQRRSRSHHLLSIKAVSLYRSFPAVVSIAEGWGLAVKRLHRRTGTYLEEDPVQGVAVDVFATLVRQTKRRRRVKDDSKQHHHFKGSRSRQPLLLRCMGVRQSE